MPIVNIQPVVADESEHLTEDDVQTLADELGDLFGGEPGSTWLKVSSLPRRNYAENRTPLPASVCPVFVEVLKRSLPEDGALAAEADRIAEVVAGVLARPKENVHILYLPPGEGRIAFGGRLLRAASEHELPHR